MGTLFDKTRSVLDAAGAPKGRAAERRINPLGYVIATSALSISG